MIWSFSAARTFTACPRKWYFEKVFADRKAKDESRNYAYFLKQLASIHAWRGKLVDEVISRFVVPKLNNHEEVQIQDVIDNATLLIEQQLAKRRALTYANCQMLLKAKVEINPFFETEYNGGLSDEVIDKATSEAKTALTNFMNSKLFAEIKNNDGVLIAQRRLQFKFADVPVTCMPDLIVFPADASPKIIDWKVEAPVYKEHWMQLAVYCLALSKVKPHKAFPTKWQQTPINPLDVQLVEFQLLRNREQNYALDTDDLVEVEDYIFRTSRSMLALVNGSSMPQTDVVPTARFPGYCEGCKFRKICWKVDMA